jgi:hypothetical protein
MNEMIYLILAEEECSNINSLIPSKYRGVLTPCKDPFIVSVQKDVHRHTKKWMHTYKGDTSEVCKYYWEADMVYAYELLGKLKSPKNFHVYEHVYIFENLSEADMSFIHMSIKSHKIFTCEFLGGNTLPSMRKNILSIMKVMEVAKNAHYILKNVDRDTDFILKNKDFNDCLKNNIAMINQLRLNKRMLNLYEKQFEKFFGLRHKRIANNFGKII